MAQVVLGKAGDFTVRFVKEKEQLEAWGYSRVKGIYEPEYLNAFFLPEEEGKGVLFMGLGEEDLKRAGAAKELGAACCKEMKKLKITSFTICLGDLYEENPKREVLIGWSEGIYLATEAAATYKTDREVTEYTVGLEGLEEGAACYLEEGHTLAESVLFARDMTNMPANYLYPEKFAEKICAFVEDTGIETQVLHQKDLQEKRMGGILGVGKGSEYAPCMVILRYRGDQNTKEITGLVGKGVTVDTGGYCIKPAASMGGIRGDMAGAAAVTGAIRALAKQKAKVNVTAVLPICENRISGGSFVDGDVLTSYSGKTIEIANTDAEGRLILADAVTWAVQDEKVTRVLDIATLTGAVVGMFGFTIAGVLCDNDALWEAFYRASEETGEKYWRIPFGKEHEKMLESQVADIKNLGGSVCGTITAGLFIRSFAHKIPWIHVDIAGTAWVDEPVYAYQEKLATGAGVDTIYQWLFQ